MKVVSSLQFQTDRPRMIPRPMLAGSWVLTLMLAVGSTAKSGAVPRSYSEVGYVQTIATFAYPTASAQENVFGSAPYFAPSAAPADLTYAYNDGSTSTAQTSGANASVSYSNQLTDGSYGGFRLTANVATSDTRGETGTGFGYNPELLQYAQSFAYLAASLTGTSYVTYTEAYHVATAGPTDTTSFVGQAVVNGFIDANNNEDKSFTQSTISRTDGSISMSMAVSAYTQHEGLVAGGTSAIVQASIDGTVVADDGNALQVDPNQFRDHLIVNVPGGSVNLSPITTASALDLQIHGGTAIANGSNAINGTINVDDYAVLVTNSGASLSTANGRDVVLNGTLVMNPNSIVAPGAGSSIVAAGAGGIVAAGAGGIVAAGAGSSIVAPGAGGGLISPGAAGQLVAPGAGGGFVPGHLGSVLTTSGSSVAPGKRDSQVSSGNYGAILTIGQAGQVTGNLTLGDTNLALKLDNAGLIAPGHSPGLITIHGDLNLQSTSVLDMQIGGLNPGTEFDQIQVFATADSLHGVATLGGLLRLSFLNSFENDPGLAGDTFAILTAGQLLGSFANVVNGGRLATADGLGSFEVDYLNNSVVLSHYEASSLVATPEPTTWASLALGAMSLVGYSRFRTARSRANSRVESIA